MNPPLRDKAQDIFRANAQITLRRVFRLNIADLQPILDEGAWHSERMSVKK
jgi:hypothetical protein